MLPWEARSFPLRANCEFSSQSNVIQMDIPTPRDAIVVSGVRSTGSACSNETLCPTMPPSDANPRNKCPRQPAAPEGLHDCSLLQLGPPTCSSSLDPTITVRRASPRSLYSGLGVLDAGLRLRLTRDERDQHAAASRTYLGVVTPRPHGHTIDTCIEGGPPCYRLSVSVRVCEKTSSPPRQLCCSSSGPAQMIFRSAY